jgi:23S rRNA (cytidine1920-2'-O)/16S rRNA (cytidine1409-2'-O)-methyltransferase
VVKKRLDVLLVERGLAESRSQAQALVLAGRVKGFSKAGDQVEEGAELEVRAGPRFVSRGGEKLAHALLTFEIDVTGQDCLDIGASTGGFTDCLLQRGAAHVVAVDVAYGELASSLRADPRVTVLERTNARALEPSLLPYRPDLVVADLSFISLAKVLPAVLACAAERFDALAMVKPQFEVGRERVGKGGVVRDEAVRRSALVDVAAAAQAAGAEVLGFAPSGLPGPAGNRETFVWLAEAGRRGAVAELERAVAAVEA